MQNEIDKSGRVEASKIGVLMYMEIFDWHDIRLRTLRVQCGSVEPTAEA